MNAVEEAGKNGVLTLRRELAVDVGEVSYQRQVASFPLHLNPLVVVDGADAYAPTP